MSVFTTNEKQNLIKEGLIKVSQNMYRCKDVTVERIDVLTIINENTKVMIITIDFLSKQIQKKKIRRQESK
jgi:hypothetical protein